MFKTPYFSTFFRPGSQALGKCTEAKMWSTYGGKWESEHYLLKLLQMIQKFFREFVVELG